MPPVDERPRVEVHSREEWRSWLLEHHASHPGIWLVVYKKHCGDRYIPWPDLVQEALCFGWIDSRTRRLDEDRTMLLFGPRKPGSVWSALNKQHVAEMMAAGRMQPAGLALVEAARADGSWTFLDDVEAGIEPEDLARALDAAPDSRRGWEELLTASTRKRVLYWIKTAKRARTRRQRIEETVRLAAEGQAPA